MSTPSRSKMGVHYETQANELLGPSPLSDETLARACERLNIHSLKLTVKDRITVLDNTGKPAGWYRPRIPRMDDSVNPFIVYPGQKNTICLGVVGGSSHYRAGVTWGEVRDPKADASQALAYLTIQQARDLIEDLVHAVGVALSQPVPDPSNDSEL